MRNHFYFFTILTFLLLSSIMSAQAFGPIAQFEYTLNGISIDFINLSSSGVQSYEWDFGDGTTSTESDPSHIYSQSGIYNVQLIVTNNSSSDIIIQEIVVIIITNTKPIQDETMIEIYPNLVKNLLHINCEMNLDYIQISNVFGEQVIKILEPDHVEEVNLKNLSSGTYIITLVSNGQIWTTEFIKQ